MRFELLTTRAYLKVRHFYWVPAYRDDRNTISRNSFRFQKEKPKPVPNPQMEWVHPTFEELANFQVRLIKELRRDGYYI